ncbi:MAG: heterocyst frequency control protein PatD [Symploca sp. SIO2E6]|nr:heterocyst frequency control protein PatD [Symploca sp. SIO2E6]
MLLPSRYQSYQAWQQALEQMAITITAKDLELAILQENFQEVQRLFRSQILTLSADDIAPDSASRWQSLQTEIYKQMRLLATDLMLFQASRSSTTRFSRQTGLKNRLNTLIQYCQELGTLEKYEVGGKRQEAEGRRQEAEGRRQSL